MTRSSLLARIGRVLCMSLVAPGCASSAPGGFDDVAGCFSFTESPPAEVLRLPWGFQLTEEAAESALVEGQRALTLDVERRTSSFPFSYWRTVPGDSIEVGAPGLGVITMILDTSRPAIELSGYARDVGDVADPARPSSGEGYAVTAERVDC